MALNKNHSEGGGVIVNNTERCRSLARDLGGRRGSALGGRLRAGGGGSRLGAGLSRGWGPGLLFSAFWGKLVGFSLLGVIWGAQHSWEQNLGIWGGACLAPGCCFGPPGLGGCVCGRSSAPAAPASFLTQISI